MYTYTGIEEKQKIVDVSANAKIHLCVRSLLCYLKTDHVPYSSALLFTFKKSLESQLAHLHMDGWMGHISLFIEHEWENKRSCLLAGLYHPWIINLQRLVNMRRFNRHKNTINL